MAMNADNVSIKRPASADGVLFWAPANTEVSADPTVELPETFKSAGYIEQSGFTFSDGQEAGDGVPAFGGDIVVAGTTTSNRTVTFSILETENIDAMALAYGEEDLSQGATGLVLTDTGALPSSKTLVFEFGLKGNKIQRVVYRNAEFSTRGDRTIDNENPDSIEVTYAIRRDNKGAFGTSHVAGTM